MAAFETQSKYGGKLRRAVVKAFPKNALTFAQDDAIDFIQTNYYHSSSRPSGGDDEASELVRGRFKEVYPPEILEQVELPKLISKNKDFLENKHLWRARRDSNPRPTGSEPATLSS